MLISNANIHTMTGKVIASGSVRICDGKIDTVCAGSLEPLPDERVLDLHGAGLYPGFIDAHTHLGMWEDGLTFEGDDGNEETDPVSPQLRAVDAINPLDRCFSEALAAGVTTVVTGPGSADPIGGQMAAIKTYGERIDDMIVKAPLAIKMALGENPKTVYHGRNEAPFTRMATASLIRSELFKAQRYMEDLERSKSDEETDPPEFDMKCESLLPVLRGEVEVHFHAHRADDIYTAVRIAKEFNLNYVVVHGTEAYLIVNGLLHDQVRVLAGPILCDRSKPELKNLTPSCPGILAKAGIETAIITDHPVIPIQYLPLCAALAVREGMDPEDALRAITINPAKICGIDGRVGTIEKGKDADLTVFASNPLSLESKPLCVIVGGNVAFGGENGANAAI
ncbi:MAG: amidohydrolase [Oscillospiraceae bacterium]|nr:amidohydrolase [Oscillospiraceae bacterium]